MREEKDIFSDLTKLCSSVGYAHVIAYFYFRDGITKYIHKMTPDDIQHLFSRERLVRTEISTLIGLMFRAEIDLTLPKPNILTSMIEETELLLKELHQSMKAPMLAARNSITANQPEFNPFMQGAFIREAIFYCGESAYNFQYREFSLKKYAKDDDWFQLRKGFSIQDAKAVICCIEAIQNEKLTSHFKSLREFEPHNWTMLPGFIFSATEVCDQSGIERAIVDKILQAFSPPEGMRNQEFNTLHDFNVTNAYPLINLGNDEYLLFQNYNIVEALYETPFYWMSADKDYAAQAMKNRGIFTEEFSAERLKIIFGKNRVWSNVST